MIELTEDQRDELAAALIDADDVLNVLLQTGVRQVDGRPPEAIYDAWCKVRGCAWLYEQRWYAERGIAKSIADLKQDRT